MKKLTNIQLLAISGGEQLQCNDSYKAMMENRRPLEDLFFLIFTTPIGLMLKIYGETSAVRSICGSNQAYDHARATYCLTHPSHCERSR